jgi:UDP-N-acetylmuramyl pentapeptide phosphotransferase/UDP-N-acetylglucosamine-1-phosphate transferase
MNTLLYFFISLLFSLIFTKFFIIFLNKKNILDIPNQRKNHKIPTPRGGGIAIISAILLSVIIFALQYNMNTYLLYLIIGISICATISLLDDILNLSILLRIIFQGLAVYFVLKAIPNYDSQILFHFIPLKTEKLLVALALVGFMNIYNFMDGIDGLTGSQTIHISASLLIFSIFTKQIDSFTLYLCINIIGACIGFLIYNWHPAKIFMGDVGSVTLGLICGWLLLNLAIKGYLIAAIIIPGYYLVDSITTIIKRLVQKKKIWQAHSEHFYQIAVRKVKSHSIVTTNIIFCNIILCALSLVSIYHPTIALLSAGLFISSFIYRLMS